MIFKKGENRLFIRIVLLFAVLCAAAYLLVSLQYKYLFLIAPVLAYQVLDLYRYQRKAQDELDQFVEAVHYRDFSRYFDVKHAPAELQPLRQGFNEINSTFKVISKEKETQYQYLQKILELVDTGILNYEMEGGSVVWMNESLKRMLQLPYLKTVHSLEKRDPELYQVVLNIRPGEGKVATAHLDKGSFKILVSCTAFQTEGKQYKLIAFQNVNEALDETESKAWQKLLNVMTHEIMNSVAPISSLADTLKNRLHMAASEIEDKNGSLEDLELGIETIKRRSEGLLRFAETYRNLNKISELHLKNIYVIDLFRNLQQLMQPTFEQKKFELEIILKEPELALEADINLLEQVLINLLVNAMDAVKDSAHPKVILSANTGPKGKTIIKVTDNGAGMSQEVLEKIFIPFFSTKKTGSGIGLSLCKQIMMLHKGNIQVQSVEGEGSAFILQF
ncbi:sensor histidine kinase [Flavihumibacter fluvii]|uniref:sensor histidine kinase n=1 Tax=Flavihumibacter fluvii TaxID=2838157 RepID=UPI001BDF5ABF|nr:HAMP domain-containing sensor histidine kinase [Flavihumibacter fluvii]ULQ54374.1 HAMP domain-containing histidine kinase [Flavihumibacter fluvii]